MHTAVVGKLAFNPNETIRLHSSCKEHGGTVTQVMTALAALANAEYALRTAGNESEECFKATASVFKSATHFQTGPNTFSSVSYTIIFAMLDSNYTTTARITPRGISLHK